MHGSVLENFDYLGLYHSLYHEMQNNEMWPREEAIDFFAQKGRDWYHVQAGYLSSSQ